MDKRNFIIIVVCFILTMISYASIAWPITEEDKQNMIQASKDGKYDIVSKIMLKEYKENVLILKYDRKKSGFKTRQELIYYYSNAFTKIYFLNLKINHPDRFSKININKESGLILTYFIIELYDTYKNTNQLQIGGDYNIK